MGVLDPFSLRGRIALATGDAGPQFGASISEGLAEAGATVIVVSRSLPNCQAFAEELRQKCFDAHALTADVTGVASIRGLPEEVIRRFGHLDVLVNSAVSIKTGTFEEQSLEDWLHAAKGAMVGLMAACQAFIPDMAARGKGSIINISSIYGVVANDRPCTKAPA